MLRRLRQALTPPDPSFDIRARSRLERYMSMVGEDGRVLDIGCGGELSVSGAVGVDVRATPATACVASGEALPFADSSFDGVTSFAVLEHVADPAAVVGEAYRVLRPGGAAYFCVPFLQGYHPARRGEADYWRFTLAGIERLCRRFEAVESGVATGPMSALAWVVREAVAAPLFNRRYAVKPVRFVAGWATALVKLLDAVAVYCPGAHRVASSVYVIGRKPGAV